VRLGIDPGASASRWNRGCARPESVSRWLVPHRWLRPDLPNIVRRPAGEILLSYGMTDIGRFFLRDDSFVIELQNTSTGDLTEAIYAFVIDDEITRIGTSADPPRIRFKSWQRSVTGALQGRRTQTPIEEAKEWKRRLDAHGDGRVFARQAHEVVTSPLGAFRTLLDEERVLLARHRPPLNRSHR
jgi:hypothetical protein